MHPILTTHGIVLAKRSVGEANILVSIFTEEFGLLRAMARSARVEKSKLRYGLEPLTLATFSFVRGKHEWKVTGVEDVSRTFLSGTTEGKQTMARVSRLLLRLIHGEERVPTLFATLMHGFHFLAEHGSKEACESAECIIVLRMLSQLGYLAPTPVLRRFIAQMEFDPMLAQEAYVQKQLLIRTINESLAVTGL